jgi:hypothetical protein
MLLLGSADTAVQAGAIVVIVICLGILAWLRLHPAPSRDRDEAMENYRRIVAEDAAKRERGDSAD